jgi:hypothetical protein
VFLAVPWPTARTASSQEGLDSFVALGAGSTQGVPFEPVVCEQEAEHEHPRPSSEASSARPWRSTAGTSAAMSSDLHERLQRDEVDWGLVHLQALAHTSSRGVGGEPRETRRQWIGRHQPRITVGIVLPGSQWTISLHRLSAENSERGVDPRYLTRGDSNRPTPV